jgi:hypothetical protein
MVLKKPVKSYRKSRTDKLKASKRVTTSAKTQWWQGEKDKSGMKLCSRCDAVYYDGHWHTAPLLSAELKKGKKRSGGKSEFCVQCRWLVHGSDLKSAGFEGQLTLDGLVDAAEKAEILGTIRNFAKRATRRDPEDQIIAIDDRGERVVVTTTENQMAVGLGKAVDAAHKGGKLRIVWSEDDLPARVFWKRKLK